VARACYFVFEAGKTQNLDPLFRFFKGLRRNFDTPIGAVETISETELGTRGLGLN
jgi:hypothetical protein